jgi:polysaccharide chain length determinant protein (PEP-CTERM system associated)
MNAAADFNVSQILSNLYRKKGLIIAVFVVVSLLAAYLATILPDIYRSSTLIVVTPQRLPASFVTSTVTMDLEERMQSIVQEILSVTQLDKIIQEFNLYPSDTKGSNLRDRVENLRKSIKVDFRRNNTRDSMTVFQLSFESGNPEKARQVTHRLATLFIDQNLQVREQQAIGTKAFMNAEVERLRKELEQQETVVNQYKAGHLYELPDQLDTNLRTLEQLRRELEANNLRLSTLQERKGTLQKQSVESDILKVDALSGSVVIQGDGITQSVQLEVKKKELDSLLQRYSSRHPDVIRLQKEIQSLEAEIVNTSSSKTTNTTNSAKVATAISPLKQVLQKQVTDIDSEIQALRSQAEGIRNQIGILQARVNNAPVRAIELSRVSRGYEITLKKYQDLLAKSLESELSENMEKNKKGEQFRILDPANLPLRPARPNRLMIVLVGLASGLAGGLALAFLWDNLDTSFKRGEEISAYVNLPLLVTIPALITRDTVLEQRRAQGLLVMASIGILAVGAVFVRILGPMYF